MKTRLLFFIILSGLIQLNLNAQTNVGGTLSSNTTWTVNGSPYTLTSLIVAKTLTTSQGTSQLSRSSEATYFSVKHYVDVEVGGGALVDFGNDGDLDYLCATPATEFTVFMRAWENDGLGNFSNATLEILGSDSIEMVNPGGRYLVEDFNSDGLPDVFIGDMGIDVEGIQSNGGQNKLFIQTESGTLSDESLQRLPNIFTMTHAECAGDIDNDGDIDIYVHEVRVITEETSAIYLNDGNGYFELDMDKLPRELMGWGTFWTCSLADIDNDGDLDLFVGAPAENIEGYDYFLERDVVLLNDGLGNFDISPNLNYFQNDPTGLHSTNPIIKKADFNNDGWIDFLEVNTGINSPAPIQLKLLLNNQDGTFRDVSNKLPFLKYQELPAIADFNGDGRIDIVPSERDNGFRLYLNRENADYVDVSSIIPVSFGNYAGPLAGDVDNDGDEDLLLLLSPTEFYVLINETPYDVLAHHPLTAPDKPELQYPPSGCGVISPPVVEWKPTSLAVDFHLQVSTDSSFITNAIDSIGHSNRYFQAQGLTTNQEYFWRVKASNSVGSGSWSEIWSFFPAIQPVLLSPANGDVLTTDPLVTWESVLGAISYQLQFSRDSTFSTVIFDSTGININEFATHNLDLNCTYYWRVRAHFLSFESPWSYQWNFNMRMSPPRQSCALFFKPESYAGTSLSNVLDLGSRFTMTAWILLEEETEGLIMGIRGPVSGGNFSYDFRYSEQTFQLISERVDPGYTETHILFDLSSPSSWGRWFHILALVDDDVMTLFVDGIEIGQAPGAGQLLSGQREVFFGNFSGAVRQVSFWNTPILSENIADIAQHYLNGDESGLVVYWPLDDGSGQIARDVTANGLDLILGTTTENDENDPLWICIEAPQQAETPSGETMLCQNNEDIDYTTSVTTYATSYEWHLMPEEAGLISGTDTIGTVDWSDSFIGIANISVKGINDCGQGEFSETLTVNVNPVYAYFENHEICEGESFTWEGTVYTEAGTYTINLTSVSGCDSIIELVLTVNPSYLFEETESICDGDTYNWQGETCEEAGTFNAEYTSEFGCDSIYQIELSVNPLPIAGFTFETNEAEVTYTNTSTNASSYLWDFGDGNTETVENPVYTYASSGNYSAVLTVYSDYCGEATDTQSVSITTGVNSIEFGNIAKIYPNPSTGMFNFEVNNHLNNDLIVQIVDVNGQVIYMKNKITKTIEVIDLSNYAKGIYFIQVRNNKYSKTEKLIIE